MHRSSTILIGTRASIASLAAQLASVPSPIDPVGCLLADFSNDCFVSRIPVLGGLADLAQAHAAFGFRHAIISLPASHAHLADKLLPRFRELGITPRFLTPLAELLTTEPTSNLHRSPTQQTNSIQLPTQNLDIAELIGRVPYGIDRRAVARILSNKRILITGAGGSIGSELVQIAAAFRPELLILMERSENALFEVDRQLARRFPEVPRKAILNDVADADETLRHVLNHRPHAIFHAAAHKHVPLMEDHPAHAVKNNLFGTKAIADAAVQAGSERFVLVSSDKAVNPSSVMGATKRLAEIYIQSLARRSFESPDPLHPKTFTPPTRFSMVRFGNVLGSACSVLPIWATQIAEGGPLTVTDQRMTRYFMTIHEAAALVIQSAAIDRPIHEAAVFVLDMGEPIRILDLAQRFIRVYNREPIIATPDSAPLLKPNQIEITLTGARPGEKLHEELAYAAENLLPTSFPGIRAWAGALSESFDPVAMIHELAAVRPSHDRSDVLNAIQRHVPEMRPAIAGSIAQKPRTLAA